MKGHNEKRCWHKYGYPPSMALAKEVNAGNPIIVPPPRRAITPHLSDASEPDQQQQLSSEDEHEGININGLVKLLK